MADIKKLPQSKFESIYRQVPRLTVEVVVATDNGIVLTQRNIEPAEGSWHIPGGTVLKGETLAAAVSRVADEELGVKIAIGPLLGTIEYPEFWTTGYGQPVGIAYLCQIVSGKLRGSNQGDRVECFWDLPQPMFPHQADFLARAIEALRPKP